MKNDNSTLYSSGLYGCLKEELKSVLNDMDNDEDLFVVSIKMMSGTMIYSLPGTLTKCRGMMTDIVDAMNDGEVMFFIGVTWVNLNNILTIRLSKYVPKEEAMYYE